MAGRTSVLSGSTPTQWTIGAHTGLGDVREREIKIDSPPWP